MRYTIITWLFLSVFAIATPVHAATIQLPKTGQSTCYNSAGAVIDCVGTGQDGEIQSGVAWPSFRFIDNFDGTVTDNLTGLIWLKNANCYGNKTWQESLDMANNLASGTCDLTDGSIPGDWRLPNIVELESLVDLSQNNPVFSQGHPFGSVTTLGNYWSSTSNPSTSFNNMAMYVRASDGYVSTGSVKTGSLWLWPVRGMSGGLIALPQTGQSSCWDMSGNAVACNGTGQDGDKTNGAVWPTPRFKDNGNGTLTDSLTGLVWLKNASCFGALTWQQALDAAHSLKGDNTLCGLLDGSTTGQWRLPNRKEILSLINRQRWDGHTWLNSQGFVNFQYAEYWTSDSYKLNLEKKWSVHPYNYTPPLDATSTHYLVPVRNAYSIINVSIASKDFGEVAINSTSAPETITISNNGEAPLVVSSIAITGDDSGMFSVNPGGGTGGNCGSLTPTIAPGGNCTISVSFSPSASGGKTATLRIVSNANNAANQDVALSGGIAPPTYIIGTSVIGNGGSISCNSPVVQGNTGTCSVTANNGFEISSVTGCGGTLSGNTYSTGTITGDCTVTAAFIAVYDYALADGKATLRCNLPLASQAVSTSCISINANYSCQIDLGLATSTPPTICKVIPVSGSAFTSATGCSGSYSGATYVTGAINSSCSLSGTLAGTLSSYTITSSVYGGNGTIDCTTSVYAGNTATCSISPATGYQLDTFTDNGADKLASVAAGSYTITNVQTAHTISGTFVVRNYTISFDSNGGNSVNSQSVTYNGTATTPTAPIKAGYTFAGWYSDSGLTTAFAFNTAITADATLYAKWAINSYTVSFNTSGGSAVSSQSVNYNAQAAQPTAPTKIGYIFGGWYSDSDLTTAFAFTTAITADTTLYAKWTVNIYTVSFDSNGGSAVNSQSVTYSGTLTAPTAPTKPGYTFGGWYSDSNLTSAFSFTTAITADTALYAKWTINSYTVSFNSNGGSSVSSQSVTYNTTATAPTAPTKTGYTFGGWYSDSDLTTAFAFTTTITADITLYAKWTINSYIVTPSIGVGSGHGMITPATAQTVNHDAATSFTITPDSGYSATVTGTCGGTLNGATFTTNPVTAACTVVANFTQVTHTVSATAGSNGSVTPANQTVGEGATASVTVTPATGYQTASVTGCGGSLSGTTYTTGTITADCMVSALFSPVSLVTTASPVSGIYTVPQNITLTTNEPATIYYTTDGTTPTTASAQYSGPIPIMESTVLRFFAVDAAGNAESVKTETYVLNTSANPSKITLVLSAVGTTSSIGAMEVTVTLPADVTVQADEVSGTVGAAALRPTGQGLDSVLIGLYAAATATAPGTVRIAMVNAQGMTAGELLLLTCDVAAGISLDASSFPTNVRAVDTSGTELSGVTASISLLTPPILSLSTLADNAVTSNATQNISGRAGDANGIKSLSINGVSVPVSGDGSFSHSLLLSAGANVISVVATNNAGSQAIVTRTITLDQNAPVITVTTPADNGKFSRASVEIAGWVDETSTVAIKVNNVAVQTVNRTGDAFSAAVSLAVGINTIEITATDRAGNMSSLRRTVTSDTGAPSLAVTDPAQDVVTDQGIIVVTGTVTDTLSAVAVTISADGQTYSPPVTDGTFSLAITLGIEKKYAITVIATDEAGNRSVTVQRNIIFRRAPAGDLNNDGKTDVSDALQALRIAVGLETATADNYAYADVAPLKEGRPSPDGVIDIADALVILEKAVGLVSW